MPCGRGAVNAHRRWRNRARTATRAVGGARQRLCPARSAAVEGPPVSHPRFPLRGASARSGRRRGEAAANGAPLAGGSRQMAKRTAERRRGVCGRAELSEGGGRRALPVVSRAGKTSISGHQTAFWHAPTLLWRALACADSADLGFCCARAFLSLKVGWVPCQNAVWWPEIAGARAREGVEVRSGGGMGRGGEGGFLAYGPCGRRACRRGTEEGESAKQQGGTGAKQTCEANVGQAPGARDGADEGDGRKGPIGCPCADAQAEPLGGRVVNRKEVPSPGPLAERLRGQAPSRREGAGPRAADASASRKPRPAPHLPGLW